MKDSQFEEIIEEENPDVLNINHTILKGARQIKIRYYFSYTKSREKNKSKVATEGVC